MYSEKGVCLKKNGSEITTEMQLGVCDSRGVSHTGEPKDAHARFQPIAGVRSHAHARIRMLAFTLNKYTTGNTTCYT
eukprot:3666394-Pleurochrysis_carterae.AAC.1